MTRASASSPWRELRPATDRPSVPLRELWEYRDVGLTLELGDFKARYKQAAFGVAWAVIQPLAGVVAWRFVLAPSFALAETAAGRRYRFAA